MNVKEIEKKMHSGKLYDSADTSLVMVQFKCLRNMQKYNKTPSTALGFIKRQMLMKKMFAEIGEGCYIEPPFYANWGGRHVHLGKNVYANFHLTLVDDTHIYIGDNTMFGPNVTIATAGHPIDPEIRGDAIQFNLPVKIGKRCWIGAGAVFVPGVTVGDDTVIGAGSVVTKDIPSGVVAVGNPCKVLREISQKDKEFYYKDLRIPDDFKK